MKETLIIKTLVLFFLISFVFSMLGMGGGQLYIPILYWLGMDFKKEAIPLGLLLNILTSASAARTYYKEGLIKITLAIPFALSMVLTAPLGAVLNFKLNQAYVIMVFATITIGSAIMILSGIKPQNRLSGQKEKIIGIISGSILGILVGLTGRGGGAIVVPILIVLGVDPKNAAATSSFIVTLASVSGFLGHIHFAHIPVKLAITSAIAVIAGSYMGSKLMVKKIKQHHIRYIFGILLIFVGLLLLKDAISSLK